jgi:uncharacterized membrane-anchored protein
MNAILAFWIAYVLTRPLGASIADWLGMPPVRHGLGLGTGIVSLALTAVLVILVAIMSRAVQLRPQSVSIAVEANDAAVS